MVAPISSSSSNISALQQRTAQTQATPNVQARSSTNRDVAQTVLNSTPSNSNKSGKIDLASANAQPQQNLPRGSIVDKLV
jgi:hypothetical protein